MAETLVLETTLRYQLEGAANYFYAGTVGHYLREFDIQNVKITDMRTCSEDFNLDKQGFELHKHTTSETNFTDDAQIKRTVYPETAEFLKKATGATKVHVFSHFVRRHLFEEAVLVSKDQPADSQMAYNIPARYVHCDQSDDGAQEILTANLPPDDATRLSRTRWGIINLWRPIRERVQRDPLAFCDARSVPDADLLPVRAVIGGGVYTDLSKGSGFEVWQARANPAHRWYFASEMTPDEVALIRIYDSKRDGRARRVLHSAFEDPRTKDVKIARQSIEVRCLVFWEDQTRE